MQVFGKVYEMENFIIKQCACRDGFFLALQPVEFQ